MTSCTQEPPEAYPGAGPYGQSRDRPTPSSGCRCFGVAGDWWITKLDAEEGLAFGYVPFLSAYPEFAEWGGIGLAELEQLTVSSSRSSSTTVEMRSPRPPADGGRESRVTGTRNRCATPTPSIFLAGSGEARTSQAAT